MKTFVVENIKVSLTSIKSHLLRTILTILIISFGIMALVGIITAIESLKYSISSNFSRMGANTFTIRNREMKIHMGGGGNDKRFESITYQEAIKFKQLFDFPAYTSLLTFATNTATVKFGTEKTNPNIAVRGTDENYLITSGNDLSKGRNFTLQEIYSGANVVIIGPELVTTLFKKKEDPLEHSISIGPGKYKIIGVLESKGTSMGFSGDKTCIVPITNVRQYFSRPNASYTISVMPQNQEMLEAAIDEATGTFRIVRGLKAGMDNNFEVAKSDNLAQMMFENIRYVTLAATIIGFITLLGAAIGLMNIMLVSVTERTREIGIRKAMGATSNTIKNQFLIEAIVICVLGGIVGILIGIPIGNIISFFVGGAFIIPWGWIIGGLILCIIVGIVSGIYPASKAARVDPIESLRYE
ncbi:MAG TPA: ABC transporter permease [Bacteroidales bacterium]|nr:ABC transporter permease [Bacteroidales bacterium]HQI44979.1 ABC transporter permease [Bacteroidales bacterium]